jgi:hypothetical protein
MSLLPTLAGIAWDPQIRNILSLVVGVGVLMGSVYLVLATDLAARLGFLVILAAFFGWMIIHGTIWWLYPPGQGPSGRVPAWDVQEIVYGDLSNSVNDKVHDIRPEGLPTPAEIEDMTPEQVEKISEEQGDRLGEWKLLAASDAAKGEAQTALDSVLGAGAVPGLEDPTVRIYTYAFETGGKPERSGDGIWDRISNHVTNTLRIKNPPHYAVVQLVPTKQVEVAAGETPPPPEADPDAQVISAVLIRDIGQRRVPAALITICSSVIFGLLCAMLHRRDRWVAEHRSAPVPATTGG